MERDGEVFCVPCTYVPCMCGKFVFVLCMRQLCAAQYNQTTQSFTCVLLPSIDKLLIACDCVYFVVGLLHETHDDRLCAKVYAINQPDFGGSSLLLNN